MTDYRIIDESQSGTVLVHKTDKSLKVGSQFTINDGSRLFFVDSVERDETDLGEFPDVLRGTSISLK